MSRAYFCFLLLLLPVLGTQALADGMLLTSPWYYVQETAQQAILRHEAGAETMTILPHFQGDANQFAWIVPLPAPPQVETADVDLFRELDLMTRPLNRYRDSDWEGCNNTSVDYLVGSEDNGGIQIIDQQTVGYYDVMTVSAEESPALIDSLTQWGFLHDGNIDSAGEAIDHYVQQGWSFATVRIDTVSFHEAFPEDWYGSSYRGQLDPLKFTFASAEMIYPLRISAVSAAESSEVVLYVADAHRRHFEGAVTRYANRFTATELAALDYPRAAAWLQEGEFLTHLRRDYAPQEMTMDLVVERAASDEEYRHIIYSGMPWSTLGLLGGPAAWFIWRRRSRPLP